MRQLIIKQRISRINALLETLPAHIQQVIKTKDVKPILNTLSKFIEQTTDTRQQSAAYYFLGATYQAISQPHYAVSHYQAALHHTEYKSLIHIELAILNIKICLSTKSDRLDTQALHHLHEAAKFGSLEAKDLLALLHTPSSQPPTQKRNYDASIFNDGYRALTKDQLAPSKLREVVTLS